MTDTDADATAENEEPLTAEERIALGVELLAHIEAEEMSVSGIVNRIETVTTVASTQRTILNTAEKQGIIVRNRERSDKDKAEVDIDTGPGIYLPGAKSVGKKDIERRDGDFTCERCGASLSTGHFINFNESEHGPFGPQCVRIVLGRDE